MSERGEPAVPGEQEISGECIALEAGLAKVRLSTGEIGLVGSPTESGRLSPGKQGTFRIERRDDAQQALLSLIGGEDPVTMPAFDREVNQLHNALANHHPTSSYMQPKRDLVGEERIQQWVNRVERRLSALRKNRARRLDEEC